MSELPTAAEVRRWDDAETLAWFEDATADMRRERNALRAEVEAANITRAKLEGDRLRGEGPRNLSAPDHGFRNRAEFYAAVIRSSENGGKLHRDERLRHSFRAGMGFAAPPQFNSEILQSVLTPESLAGRCRILQSSQSTVSFPADDQPPWNSALAATWLGGPVSSSVAIEASKPDLSLRQFNLKRVAVLVPATDELLDDAPALESYLDSVGPSRLQWELDYQLLHGTGVARPLGILNAPGTIVVGREASQAADTVVLGNITSMLSAFGGDRSRAIWLVHPDVEAQLVQLALTKDPIYTFTDSGTVGRLLGIPVVVHEACAQLGDPGDIVLADFNEYDLVVRSRRRAMSTHLWFDQNLTAFRYVVPVDGQPRLGAPFTSRVGGGTRSPFVILAERA